MIKIVPKSRIEPLAVTLKNDYDTSHKVSGYTRFLLGAFLVWVILHNRPIYDLRVLTSGEYDEYIQALETTLNDRLKDEDAMFTVKLKRCRPNDRRLRMVEYKLDYSEYTGTEDTDLLYI